jgi:hypothetical protein
LTTFSATHESRKVLTVTGAISARAKYLLRKIETSRRKTAARKAAKAELFSARLWPNAKNLRRTQLNNLTFTGHDSVVADHGSSASHDATG